MTAAPCYNYGTIAVFGLVTTTTLVGLPVYGYFYDFTATAWILLGVLYFATGLGITVGYHRLVAHRSFECPPMVKAILLVIGGWALENSALKWASDHIRHHAQCDQDQDPY